LYQISIFIILGAGFINHKKYANDEVKFWKVESNCESVHIFSKIFKTEREFDQVGINGKPYSGKIAINEVIPSNFTVSFKSDSSSTKFGFKLEWRCSQCCLSITLSGARQTSANQRYFQNGTLINNRPFYIGSSKKYGIWFDEVNYWMVGTISYLNKRKLKNGFIFGDEVIDCPAKNKMWKEYFDESWTFNNEINLTCHGRSFSYA